MSCLDRLYVSCWTVRKLPSFRNTHNENYKIKKDFSANGFWMCKSSLKDLWHCHIVNLVARFRPLNQKNENLFDNFTRHFVNKFMLGDSAIIGCGILETLCSMDNLSSTVFFQFETMHFAKKLHGILLVFAHPLWEFFLTIKHFEINTLSFIIEENLILVREGGGGVLLPPLYLWSVISRDTFYFLIIYSGFKAPYQGIILI